MKKYIIALLLAGVALTARAANDSTITTDWPQTGDTEKDLMKRFVYSFANYANNVTATNANIVANTLYVTNAVTALSTLNVAGTIGATGAVYYPKGTLTLVNSTGNSNVTANAARVYKVTGPDSAFTISGMKAGSNGQMVTIYSLIAQNMTFAHEDSTVESNAVNRITTLTGSDVSTTAAGAATLIYDSTTTRWILLSVTQ